MGVLGAVTLLAIVPTVAETRTILLCVNFIILNTILTGLTTWGFSHFKIAKKLFYGSDSEFDFKERALAVGFVLALYLSNAIIIGLTILAVYMAQLPVEALLKNLPV